LQVTDPILTWAAVAESDGSKAATTTEGFCSVGLGSSVASDTLQQKVCQLNIISELKEANYKNTSMPSSSSPLVFDDASSTEASHHQRARHQQQRLVTFSQMTQICIQK
jgi:hypothetical protein